MIIISIKCYDVYKLLIRYYLTKMLSYLCEANRFVAPPRLHSLLPNSTIAHLILSTNFFKYFFGLS